MTTKNARYIQSLVEFINDVKPYHCKITEIVDEYKFFDTVDVNVKDVNYIWTHFNSKWQVNVPSDGWQTRLRMPPFLTPRFTTGVNEHIFKGVASETIDIPGVLGVMRQRAAEEITTVKVNGFPQPQAIDFFISHGVNSFKVDPANRTWTQLDREQNRWKTSPTSPNYISTGFEVKENANVYYQNYISDLFKITHIESVGDVYEDWTLEVFNIVTSDFQPLTSTIFTPPYPTTEWLITKPAEISDVVFQAYVNDPENPDSLVAVLPSNVVTTQNHVLVEFNSDQTGILRALNAIDTQLQIFTHEQTTPAITWNIAHDIGSMDVIIQSYVIDDTGKFVPILPLETIIIDKYHAQVKFSSPLAGKVILASSLDGVGKTYEQTVPLFVWNFANESGSSNPVISVYVDGPDGQQMIIPNKVTVSDTDITVTFTSSPTSPGYTGKIVTITEPAPVVDFVAFNVYGEVSGYNGIAIAGKKFTSPKISFRISHPLFQDRDLKIGDKIVIQPTCKVYVSPTAPVETWSLIKTDPLAYSRPLFLSKNLGYLDPVIINHAGVHTQRWVLTAISPTEFTVVGEVTGPTANAFADIPYSNSEIGFTINSGTSAFQETDWFEIFIENPKPTIDGLSLSDGYDPSPNSNNAVFTAFMNYLFSLAYVDAANALTATGRPVFQLFLAAVPAEQPFFDLTGPVIFDETMLNDVWTFINWLKTVQPSTPNFKEFEFYSAYPYNTPFQTYDLDSLGLTIVDQGAPTRYWEISRDPFFADKFDVIEKADLAFGQVTRTFPQATLGVPYDNGVVSFTIQPGPIPFPVGSKFTFTLTNPTPYIKNGRNVEVKNVTFTSGYAAANNFTTPGIYVPDELQVWTITDLVETSFWELSAQSPTTFSVNQYTDSSKTTLIATYVDATVDVPYDNGKVRFTIVPILHEDIPTVHTPPYPAFTSWGNPVGSSPASFVQGDKITFYVKNYSLDANELPPIEVHSTKNPYISLYASTFWNCPAQVWTLTAISSTTFDVVGTVSGNQGTATVGETYFSDLMSFTIYKASLDIIAGDVFKFEVFADKPSYLVFGTVSGWQEPATVGKRYFNGKIGFTIPEPFYQIEHIDGDKTTTAEIKTSPTSIILDGTRSIQFTHKPRLDAVTEKYSLQLINEDDQVFSVNRSVAGSGTGAVPQFDYTDLVKIGTDYRGAGNVFFKIDGQFPLYYSFDFNVKAHDFDLWYGHDLIIFKNRPALNSSIIIDGAESDTFRFWIQDSAKNHEELGTTPKTFAYGISKGGPITLRVPGMYKNVQFFVNGEFSTDFTFSNFQFTSEPLNPGDRYSIVGFVEYNLPTGVAHASTINIVVPKTVSEVGVLINGHTYSNFFVTETATTKYVTIKGLRDGDQYVITNESESSWVPIHLVGNKYFPTESRQQNVYLSNKTKNGKTFENLGTIHYLTDPVTNNDIQFIDLDTTFVDNYVPVGVNFSFQVDQRDTFTERPRVKFTDFISFSEVNRFNDNVGVTITEKSDFKIDSGTIPMWKETINVHMYDEVVPGVPFTFILPVGYDIAPYDVVSHFDDSNSHFVGGYDDQAYYGLANLTSISDNMLNTPEHAGGVEESSTSSIVDSAIFYMKLLDGTFEVETHLEAHDTFSCSNLPSYHVPDQNPTKVITRIKIDHSLPYTPTVIVKDIATDTILSEFPIFLGDTPDYTVTVLTERAFLLELPAPRAITLTIT
ncbi:MAG: hypothetical protein QXN55_01800 [Candidatus Nitrosotenuis sp.]